MPTALVRARQSHFITARIDRGFVVFCCSLAVLPIVLALLLFALCYFGAISLEQINDAFWD